MSGLDAILSEDGVILTSPLASVVASFFRVSRPSFGRGMAFAPGSSGGSQAASVPTEVPSSFRVVCTLASGPSSAATSRMVSPGPLSSSDVCSVVLSGGVAGVCLLWLVCAVFVVWGWIVA